MVFNKLNNIVYFETCMSYLYSKVLLILHADAPIKQMGAAISQNNKQIELLASILRNTKFNYNARDTEPISIV